MITKTQLVEFIDSFNGEEISKQDVLNFIENSKVTRVYIDIDHVLINDKRTDYDDEDYDELKAVLNKQVFGKEVKLTHDSYIDVNIALDSVGYFVDKGYKVEDIDSWGTKLVK